VTSARKQLGKADYQLLADFRYILRQFLSFSEDAANRAGLAPQQHQVLLAIKGAGGQLSIGDLAQRLLVQPHSAVGLVDRLVEAKLLHRVRDQKDRRRVLLTLTPNAERVLKSLTVTHRDEIGRVAPILKSLLSELEK
jgi:DNA-binding MarR family transcriptional regulator